MKGASMDAARRPVIARVARETAIADLESRDRALVDGLRRA